MDINSITETFDNLLINNQHDILRYINIIFLYFYFLSKRLIVNSGSKNKILHIIDTSYENLISSPYTMIITKIEVIKQILLGNQEKIILKLVSLNEQVNITEIDRITMIVESFNYEGSNLGDLIIEIISPDLFYSNFENRMPIPIKLILEK